MQTKGAKRLTLVEQRPEAAGDERSDEGLMLLCAEDSLQAFTKLVSKNESAIRRYCFGMLGNRPAAEEVAQETFLKLWLNRKRYRAKDKFRAYLFCIARRQCISRLRRRRFLSFVGLNATPPAAALHCEQDDSIDIKERNAILRGALSTLPPKLRSAVILRFVEEMSYADIAKISGKSPSAIRSRIHYGLKELAQSLPEEVRTWAR